jgi:hypothetical protein
MKIHRSLSSHFSLRRCALTGLLGLVLAQTATAATLRGRLDRRQPNGKVAPAAGITVTVFFPGIGRSVSARTGADGMYYLYSVRPGSQTLEIWTSPDPRAAPESHSIQVRDPVTDVPPIVVR